MRKTIWPAIGVLSGIGVMMTQISAQQAKSNIGSWLNLVGFNPEWAQFENIDKIVMVLASSVLAIPIILFIIKIIHYRLPSNKLMSKHGIHIYFAEHWLNMSSQSKMVETRGDTAIWSEPDWRITSLYFEAKNKRNTKIEKAKGYVESNETKKKFDILIDSYKPEETHGIPANTDFKISAIFPSSTPDREGWTFEDFWSQFGSFNLYLDFDGIKMAKKFSQKEIREYIDTYLDSLTKRNQGKPRVERKSQTIDTPSPLKIEVQKDGNAYINIEDVKGHGIKQGSLQRLSIKIHNTSKEAIDNVETCLNKIEGVINDIKLHPVPDSLGSKLPIYLHFANTDIGALQFSADQARLVDVVSFFTAHSNCDLIIEQIGKEPKPETFMSAKTVYEIEIKVTGTGVCSSQQNFKIYMIGSKVQLISHSKQRIFMKRIFKGDQVLEEQQKPKLQIGFDENNPDYYYESEWFELLSYSFGHKKVFDGYDEKLTYLRLCRISVYNSSDKETIEGVEVQLTKIDKPPDRLKGVLPIHLQLKDDRNGQKVFDLSPQSRRYVDVVMWQLTPEKATPEYVFCNVLKDVGDRSVPIHNSKTEYEIRIEVTGKNTPCETKDFKVGMVNKDNTFEKIWIWPV